MTDQTEAQRGFTLLSSEESALIMTTRRGRRLSPVTEALFTPHQVVHVTDLSVPQPAADTLLKKGLLLRRRVDGNGGVYYWSEPKTDE